MVDPQERAIHLLSDQDGMSTPDQEVPVGGLARKRRHKRKRKQNTVSPSGYNLPANEPAKIQGHENEEGHTEPNPSRQSHVFGTGEGKLGSVNIQTSTWVPDHRRPIEVIDGNIALSASDPSFADLHYSEDGPSHKAMGTASTLLNTWPPQRSPKKIYHQRSNSEKISSKHNLQENGLTNTYWWRFYNTKMTKDCEECLLKLVTDSPTLESVLIKYFISLYDVENEGGKKNRGSIQKTGNKQSDIQLKMMYIAENLDNGTDIDYEDSFGQTILMEVVRSWHTDVATYLIDNDANINHYDQVGRAPIHVAAAADRADMIELLHVKGASINAKTKVSEETPLHLAARRSSLEALKKLLSKGANTEIADYRGRTALYLAAEYDRQAAVSLLIQAGADVGTADKDDVTLLVQLASTSSPNIEMALNKLISVDNLTGKGKVNSEILERCPKRWYEDVQTNCLLDIIQSVELGDAVRHIAIKNMFGRRWKLFGRTWTAVNFVLRLLFLLVWTVWILVIRWEEKAVYSWPEDGWRLVLPVIGLFALIWEIRIEISEMMYSIRRGVRWAELQLIRLAEDKQFLTHPRWQEEYDQLVELSKRTKKKTQAHHQIYQYTKDLWNLYDIGVFVLLTGCMITHVVDALEHTSLRSRIHGQLGSMAIILLGIRLMKETRGFVLTGELVIMLGLMAADFGRFIFLYLQLYIPFTIAFWIIFGGDRYPYQSQTCLFSNCTDLSTNSSMHTRNVDGWVPDFDMCSSNCTTIRVAGMETYPKLCFSLFRLTLVDEYDFESMRAIDPFLSYLLIGAFLITSAIVGINFLIGLISSALGDGAREYVKIHTLLQKVKVINLIEQTIYLCPPRPEKCREQLVKEAGSCNPLDVDAETVTSLTLRESIDGLRKDMVLVNNLVKNVNHIQEDHGRFLSLYKAMKREKPVHSGEPRSKDSLGNRSHNPSRRERRRRQTFPSGLGKLGSFNPERGGDI